MSETYEEVNERMGRTLGARAAGSIGGFGMLTPMETARRLAGGGGAGFDPVAELQGVRVGGITFRSEPANAIDFIPDAAAQTITLRLRQVQPGNAIAAVDISDPFQPKPVTGSAAVTFEPGIIISGGTSISPTVGGGSPMATVPRPQLTITTSGTIYLEATLDGAGNATAVDTKNAATTPASTATLARLTIATVTLAGTDVTVTSRPVRESRTLYLCNGSAIWDA